MRKRLPDERPSLTHKFSIRAQDGTAKGYVTVGLYDDGSPGELFVKMDKQGSLISGFVDAFAIGMSMLLQEGVSLEALCAKYRGMAFEPSGRTDNPNIPFARSPIDYIARYLAHKFLGTAENEAA
jgi:ribonucleoside-diphosphate reductase alpha chain